MLLSLEDLIVKYEMHINGVFHGGGHLAEEAASYHRLGCGPVYWVEANPAVIPMIEQNLLPYPEQTIIQALLYEEDGVELTFNVTNYDGMSSSIYEFGTHPTFSPDTIFVDHLQLQTTTIDTLVARHNIRANAINLDLQGAELVALKGATKLLSTVDYIFLEVNDDDVYVGCARVEQLDALLREFERVETYWVPGQSWGDSLYLRRGA